MALTEILYNTGPLVKRVIVLTALIFQRCLGSSRHFTSISSTKSIRNRRYEGALNESRSNCNDFFLFRLGHAECLINILNKGCSLLFLRVFFFLSSATGVGVKDGAARSRIFVGLRTENVGKSVRD